MDTLLHPSHWFNTHDHHKCLFPFKVVAYKDYNGVHKNKEISFKRGDVIQVSGQCDENGHNIQDVPRISKRLRNGVINVKYPLYPTDDTNTFWVGRVMKYNPDTHHYAVTHDIGHFPVNCVALMEDKAKLDQLKNESKSGTDAKKKNSHITVSMNTPHTMLEKQDDRLKVSFSDKNNLGITFRTCKHRDGSHKVFTVVESVDNSNTAGLENIEPFFLLANIGEENVEEKSHEEIEVILNTCEYPVTMTFVHPSEEKHPYNKHEHHQHMEHVTNIEANKFKDLEIELDFEEGKNENEEAVKYMYVKSSKHLALNNYVLSSANFKHTIGQNINKDVVENILEDPNESKVRLKLLSPSHPQYPKRSLKNGNQNKIEEVKREESETKNDEEIAAGNNKEHEVKNDKEKEEMGNDSGKNVESDKVENGRNQMVGEEKVEKKQRVDGKTEAETLNDENNSNQNELNTGKGEKKEKFDGKAEAEALNGDKNSNENELKTETNDNTKNVSRLKLRSPDGNIFNDQSSYNKYMMETYYTYKDKSNLTGENMLIKYPGDVDNVPFDIKTVDNCEIAVLGNTSQVQIDDVKDSRIFIGPVDGTLFIRNCKNVNFTIACRQLRTFNCENCTLNMYVATDPILEKSSDITIKPFNGAYKGLIDQFEAANLDPTDNHKNNVFDFNKDGKDDYDKPEPHFKIHEEKDKDWAFDIANLIQVNDGSLDEHNPVPYTATSTSQSDIGQRYDDVNKNATENSTAEKKHVQSNAKITAANRAEISSRSSSTSTISTISSIGNNDDKVAMEKKIQKEKKILRLAQKAQIDQKYAKAEMLFRKINRWQRACFMYFQDEKYQDAKRVAYKEAGKAGFEEVIFAWSKHLGKEKGADFVLEFGGIKVAIDFYCDRCEFERAFELSKERGGKAKIKDIHLKYGQFYEEQGNFPAAEKQYILAGKPREAIEMYKREDKVLHALRVAQEHEPAHVDDIEASLQLTVLDLINRSQTGLFSRRSINALQNDLSQRVNLRGDDRRMKHLKMSPRSRQRVARNGYMVEKKELANRERERMNINKNRRRQHELQQIRVASHDAYKKAFGGLNNKFSNVSWTKATIQDQHGLLRATQPIQIEYEKFKIQKFDPRKKTIQRRYAAGKLVPPPPPLRRRPNPDASSAYYSRGNNTNNNVLFSNNDNIITANNRSPRQTNKIKKSRFSPRPPDIYKMARAKNKRLRVSPITLFQQQKNKAPMQPVMSSLSLDDSLDDESILEIFNEDVTVVNVRKKVSVKLPPSPPTSSKTMLNSEQSPRKQRQRRQQRKKEQKTDKPAQNGQSPKEPSKQNKTADGETIIQGLELDLVLHDPTSFTIL